MPFHRKYGNNIPQKVQIFGRLLLTDRSLPIVPPIVQHTGVRVPLISVNASINTGQVYNNLLNEDLAAIVPPNTSALNQQWVDITLSFSTTNKINKLSFYNLDSLVTTNQSTIFYKTDTGLVFITNYTTGAFNTLTNINLVDSPLASAIVIRKIGNIFPQKIIVYGNQDTLPTIKIPIDVSR